MSGQHVAYCVIAGLGVLSVTGVTGAFRMWARGASPGFAVLLLGPSVTCGAWALLGIAWWLSGGQVSLGERGHDISAGERELPRRFRLSAD